MLLTIKQAAARLNTSERHIRELTYRRLISFHKIGHLVRIDEDDLEKWLAGQKVTAATDRGAA